MAAEIKMPKLGMTMSEAKVVEWNAMEGDWIEKGTIVLTIETEKLTWGVEAVRSGFLHLMVKAEKVAEVGATLGLLVETPEELKAIQKEPPAPGAGEPMAALSMRAPSVEVQIPRKKEFAPASPLARRLARELGVDLAMVPGTGPEGRIIEADVRKYSEKVFSPPKISPLAKELSLQAGLDLSKIAGTGEGGKITRADVERALKFKGPEEEVKPVWSIPFTGMRKTIAENLYASLQKTAQVTTFTEVDVTETVRLRDLVREEYRNDEASRVSYNDMVILATSRVLKRFPIMNSTLVADEILVYNTVNMGIAVALPHGVIVPVLRDAHKKGLLQIAREASELARKARENTLTLDDVTGGTFTITNVGMFDVDGGTPILRPPETGILGVGRVKEKPAVYNGQIAIRSMMTLSLTSDHRVVDGAETAKFLSTLARYLQNPALINT
ncbi:MAG: dihydrolipoyllysine acetyltransferase [Deltaproteobacteria bacterium RBG_16_47_11]|nr:MAG: dihydrolipoyllysine acetyltransferase [Deltaproteobacteria bacterium RBG_16_47_11]